MSIALGQLVVRVEPDLRKKSIARLKAIASSTAGPVAVVESYVDGQWVESKATAPPDAYRVADVMDIAHARHSGKLPEAKGIYPITDTQLSVDLLKPSMTEAEVDAFVLDLDADQTLRARLLQYMGRAGYPNVRI